MPTIIKPHYWLIDVDCYLWIVSVSIANRICSLAEYFMTNNHSYPGLLSDSCGLIFIDSYHSYHELLSDPCGLTNKWTVVSVLSKRNPFVTARTGKSNKIAQSIVSSLSDRIYYTLLFRLHSDVIHYFHR